MIGVVEEGGDASVKNFVGLNGSANSCCRIKTTVCGTASRGTSPRSWILMTAVTKVGLKYVLVAGRTHTPVKSKNLCQNIP